MEKIIDTNFFARAWVKSIGDDPDREGLRDTFERVLKSHVTLYAGYKEDIDSLVTTFDSEGYDEMIILRDIEFYSTCEHHIQPFFGKGHIGYIPNGKLIGISKLARILDHFARRLQNQERVTSQVAEFLMTRLQPQGVGVILEAQHLCMRARGVQKQNSIMVTSALRGSFRETTTRSEFMRLIR